ncbi:MAG: hypothetical protein ACR2PX_01585, partial [Endozoicomonas sp.]|uniref:hypothetical protein n=1 Tax=Endozoicomonas sp. TaxID=1892382 RepID=UPI003D9B04C2
MAVWIKTPLEQALSQNKKPSKHRLMHYRLKPKPSPMSVGRNIVLMIASPTKVCVSTTGFQSKS